MLLNQIQPFLPTQILPILEGGQLPDPRRNIISPNIVQRHAEQPFRLGLAVKAFPAKCQGQWAKAGGANPDLFVKIATFAGAQLW
jgi:hypothetical protein